MHLERPTEVRFCALFCECMIFVRFYMAVNSVLLSIETSNVQEILSYLYAAVHIEKNT